MSTKRDREKTASASPDARVRRSSAAGISRARAMRQVRDDGSNSRRRGSAAGNTSSKRARSRALPRKKVASVKQGKYRVVFERDESGAWIARVPAVRGCHTYGRTIDQARRRIREALGLWVGDAETAELVEEIRLPSHLLKAIRDSRAARTRAENARAKARAVSAATARALVNELHLGLRDAAELLGLSHQRVQQLVRSSPR